MGQAAPLPAQQGIAASERSGAGRDVFADLDALRDMIAMLPAAVTVMDAHGRVVFANGAAAEQFNTQIDRLLAGTDPGLPRALAERREACIELVRTGQSQTNEEIVGNGPNERVFLTTHRPVWIAERRLVLSSSVEITQHKQTEAELFRRAYFDDLTGLPNRKLIEQHADHLLSLRDAPRFALAFLDIDNFKHINDYYGHAAGDALLVEVSKRLTRDLRRTDTLSRISGDEFLLLLSPVQSFNEVADFIDHLVDKLKTPFFIEGSEIFAAASIGVSLYPDHGQDFKQLRQNADIAMYRVKHETKGNALFFDAGMEREAAERTEIEQSLRVAILEKRFRCVFQPKVDIRTREVKGIEALVRLKTDSGAIQPPGSFINLAVELGLIDELTHLVLAEIMKSIDLVNDEFGKDTSISINVAAKQAGDVAFMTSFAHALEATGCPQRFIVEVTEDAFLSKAHFQTEILPMLRELGVGISIDDFGVGYSSLSALADITADEIKIDRSFIMDIHKRPRSQGILRAIVSLAEALGMTVIAEGVELHEELAYLQAATKIRYAQGYYFAKPIFLDELQPSASHVVHEARPEDFGRQRIAARGGR